MREDQDNTSIIPLRRGEIRGATILHIGKDRILVDLGSKGARQLGIAPDQDAEFLWRMGAHFGSGEKRRDGASQTPLPSFWRKGPVDGGISTKLGAPGHFCKILEILQIGDSIPVYIVHPRYRNQYPIVSISMGLLLMDRKPKERMDTKPDENFGEILASAFDYWRRGEIREATIRYIDERGIIVNLGAKQVGFILSRDLKFYRGLGGRICRIMESLEVDANIPVYVENPCDQSEYMIVTISMGLLLCREKPKPHRSKHREDDRWIPERRFPLQNRVKHWRR